VRKLLGWIVVTVGIAALVRKLRSRPEPAEVEAAGGAAPASVTERTAEPSTEAEPEQEDPATELRRKLADSRGDEPGSEPALEERRSEVHDQARAAIDEMHRSAED
jgi:hypothetical protein